jgi:predicted MPP superfamily phosphohydrolase
MWQVRLRRLLRLATALIASLAVWLFVINRIVIHWVDGPAKAATMGLLAVGLGCGAVFSLLRFPEVDRLWPAVLVLFGIGEVHRALLRREYRADSESTANLWHPVTTTDLVVRRFALEVPGLAVARLRVLHLSDLHVTENLSKSYVERVEREMRDLDPDLIVMTGDYVSRVDRLPFLAAWLQMLPATRYGAYAVLGNHDYWTGDPERVRTVLTRAGIRVMGRTCTNIDVAKSVLRLCGTEEPWGVGYSRETGGDEAGPPVATLILSHTPDNVYEVAEGGMTVLFAGHTHGGQFRLPGLGALVVPSRYGRRFEEGHFVVNQTHLFVSAGVGADAPALRLWCPPELLVVDLVGRGSS